MDSGTLKTVPLSKLIEIADRSYENGAGKPTLGLNDYIDECYKVLGASDEPEEQWTNHIRQGAADSVYGTLTDDPIIANFFMFWKGASS